MSESAHTRPRIDRHLRPGRALVANQQPTTTKPSRIASRRRVPRAAGGDKVVLEVRQAPLGVKA